VNVMGQGLAILEGDHSPSPLLKIAATFFDSTRTWPSRRAPFPCGATRVRALGCAAGRAGSAAGWRGPLQAWTGPAERFAAKPPTLAGTSRWRGTRRSCRPRPSPLWSGPRRTGPPGPGAVASRLRQRLAAPALQRVHADSDLMGNLQRRALGWQQPRHRLVFECLSVSSQFVLSSPPGGRFYRGDK